MNLNPHPIYPKLFISGLKFVLTSDFSALIVGGGKNHYCGGRVFIQVALQNQSSFGIFIFCILNFFILFQRFILYEKI